MPYLSLLENVLLPCHFSARRRDNAGASGLEAKEASELLDHLGLTGEIRRRTVTQLSVGQQPPVAVARALIGVTFILAAGGALILLASNPHGAERLKDLPAGQIL